MYLKEETGSQSKDYLKKLFGFQLQKQAVTEDWYQVITVAVY